MKTSNRGDRSTINVWTLVQRYVEDTISPGTAMHDSLSGWIRSRSTARLATCSTLLDLHSLDIGDLPLLRSLLQIECFFKKNQSLSVGADTEAVALENFLKAETLCRITNKRLDYYLCAQRDRLDPDLRRWISRASKYVSDVLGSYPDFLESVPKYVRVSGGATATRPRTRAHPTMKVRRNGISTLKARPLCEAFYSYAGLPGQYTGRTIEWNRILWVPKNFKTARTIACEPDGNIPFQLAFDGYVKDRLRRVRQDLSDQSRNQRDAYTGSVDGSIATIDFSMASDTVSLNAVHALFPEDFASYLCMVRSPFGKLPDGRTVKYAKLSSMGNGATFSVETLIFLACAKAVGSKLCNVYGDDVTIETHLVDDYLRLTRFLGFVPNREKTYSTGLFRESCGKFYLAGHDVTPHYLRTNVGRPANISLLVNGLSSRGVYLRTFGYLVSLIKEHDVPLVPVNDDPCTGVFVSPSFAHSKRLLYTTGGSNRKYGPFVVVFKGLQRRGTDRYARAHTAHWLWHLSRFQSGGVPRYDEDPPELSKLTQSLASYRIRELNWREPVGGLPDLTVLEVLIGRA